MNELKARFAQEEAAYEVAIAQGNKDEAQALNVQLAATLSQMIAASAMDPTNIRSYRDELVKKLIRIQHDYNGLITSTDDLETLRRIRNYETTKFDFAFTFYLWAFLILAILLVVIILFKTQRVATNAMSAVSPATMPALT
jgi:hypothetical protein